MTNHKRGNTHWTTDYKKCKEERDALLLKVETLSSKTGTIELNANPFIGGTEHKYTELLREIYSMLNQYYCDTQQIKYKIEQSGVIDE